MKKYEEQDDKVFANAFGKEVKDTHNAKVAGYEEAKAEGSKAIAEKPAPTVSSKPKAYDGPGKNIDCDKATGDLMPGNDCGHIHQPAGESKAMKALGNRDYSKPIKGSTKIDGLDPGAGVPGLRL